MDAIELEESSGHPLLADERPRMADLPPVRLLAVEDVRLIAAPEFAVALHPFYQGILEFLCESQSPVHLTFRAENFRLRVEIVPNQKPLERDGVRPLGILVKSLRDAEKKLFAQQIAYERQRGLLPGQLSLLLQDPAGNWIELFESIGIG